MCNDTRKTGTQNTGKLIDLHCHSRYSHDGNLSFVQIAKRIKKKGLDGFAVTDHNCVAGQKEFEQIREKFPKIILVPGCEVSSLSGHILAIGVTETPEEHKNVKDTLSNIREMGGVPIFAHPFRKISGIQREVIDQYPEVALEAVNGRSRKTMNKKVIEIGKEKNAVMTGGSDGHVKSDIGRAWTVFPQAVEDTKDAICQLENGNVVPGGIGMSSSLFAYSKIRGTARWLTKLSITKNR